MTKQIGFMDFVCSELDILKSSKQKNAKKSHINLVISVGTDKAANF